MRSSIIGIFAQHRVAANLLMVMMLLSGVIALQKLNVQFFPNFELDRVTVSTIWSGASAEDVESGITIPLEQRLRSIDNLKEFTSTSATGTSGITLEFDENGELQSIPMSERLDVLASVELPEGEWLRARGPNRQVTPNSPLTLPSGSGTGGLVRAWNGRCATIRPCRWPA